MADTGRGGRLRLVLLVGLLAPIPAAAQQGDATRIAKVIYLGRDWVFIDAGWVEGLRQGFEMEVVRRGRIVAVLRVESVGDHRASGVVVNNQVPLMYGDSVRYTPVGSRPKAPAVVAERPAPQVPAAPPAAASPTPTPPPAAVPRAAPPPQPVTRNGARATSTVTFVSGAEIYVGAGRQDGLTDGAELSVVRRDSVVSTLRVKFLASHQASCEIIRGATAVVVGEVVRFVVRMPATPRTTTDVAARPRRPRRLSGPGIHGRLGLRHLHATSTTESSGVVAGSTGFNQPSFDLRMNGLSIGGTPVGLAVDLRTRRTVTSSTGQPNSVDGRTRVYQAAIYWGAPGAGFRTVAGRQFLTAVTSVSMFDGGLFEFNGARTTFGVFGGVEPDAATLGFSNAIQDYGGYLQFHAPAGKAASWTFTTGAVGSLEASHANRVFGFVQASVNNPTFSLYALQEVDYYPWWKVQLGENQFSFTSQYANGLVRASPWLSFSAFYDRRRSVRLYRDTQTPETDFDDAYRQGYGSGIQLSGYKIRVAGDWRRSTGGTAGRADSYTGTLGLDPVTPYRVGVSLRATWYQNQNDSTSTNPLAQRSSGQLYSAWLGFEPVGPLHVSINGGLRHEDNLNTTTAQTSRWYGVDLDAAVARAWYVAVSGLRQADPANPGTSTTTQLYASVTWRF